jgi:hypothetical protein
MVVQKIGKYFGQELTDRFCSGKFFVINTTKAEKEAFVINTTKVQKGAFVINITIKKQMPRKN